MNDAENLSKLLGHLPPAVFSEFMVEEFELTMPALDKKQTKRDQRAEMETVLSGLDINHRQRIEEVAERIRVALQPLPELSKRLDNPRLVGATA